MIFNFLIFIISAFKEVVKVRFLQIGLPKEEPSNTGMNFYSNIMLDVLLEVVSLNIPYFDWKQH